jgi:hypothetical protein
LLSPFWVEGYLFFHQKKYCGCFWLVAFRGRGGATATPRGLKSFKVLADWKKGSPFGVR